ncbi:hypothetical protein GAYE_SCF29G4817 [Galdieria yellowstonensis]|uniref:Glutamate--cysteine ligase n=1 Tax=Galdieria yellowstonensis TaxID=3028027 RepID=A0AAV9IHK2_9RHOD|nr:hypothetical protein GAYE_SCF29G4817 [Galdieria yellowstonensis]
MGLLSTGHPLTWKESKPYIRQVKRKGIQQFIHLYHATRNRKDDCLRWGDEVEYTVLHVDKAKHKITLSLRAPEILAELQKQEHLQPEGSSVEVLWRPEYANWMVEGTPGVPYRCFAGDLELVEQNMMLRRLEIFSVLKKNEIVLSITAFPLLGCDEFTTPVEPVLGPAALSLYVPDAAINPHPRFPTLTRNIRHRRGRKVDIRRPVFPDQKTEKEFPVLPQGLASQNGHSDEINNHHVSVNHDAVAANSEVEEEDIILLEQLAKETTPDIYMDCMAFGMGCCCLQVTLQGKDMDESRYLYDQLAVFAPIMLALTAATPILKGYLLDTDSRWDVICGAVDDRTPEEMRNGPKKSRYDSIDLFVSSRKEMIPERYNDVEALLDEESYRTLIASGVDERLARHVAHLFIRDPLVIYEESMNVPDEQSTEHFENIQSTNWNTVRLKPPSLDSNAGWRTEFRPMEVQFTDFENAAFAVFTVLVSRVIIAFDLNFYIPISLVDRNMKAAQARDAVKQQKFYFRRNVFADNSHVPDRFKCACGRTHQARFSSSVQECCLSACSSCSDCELMTVDQIINGKSVDEPDSDHHSAFPGLISLIRGYLDAIELPPESAMKIGNYLDFISAKAKGELLTNASWIRKFVLHHESYRHDSVINDSICYDLLKAIHDINTGKRVEYELLGDFYHGKGDCNEVSAEMLQEMRTKVEKGPTLVASKDIFQRLHNLASLSDDALMEMEKRASVSHSD